MTSQFHLTKLLPTVIAGFRDIVELKRPDMEVLFYDGSHKNYYPGYVYRMTGEAPPTRRKKKLRTTATCGSSPAIRNTERGINPPEVI